MNLNKPVSLLLAAAFTCVAALPAQAADSLRAGFSTERLARVDALLDSYVNDGRIGGVVALVLRDGKPVYERAVGWSDREAGRKMSMDTEFRIASQSKALTSVAILQLMEEGKLTVNERAGKYIPTFEQTSVLTRVENSTYYGELHIERGGTVIHVDSRPSDAIAIAIRLEAPIFASESLLVEPGDDEEDSMNEEINLPGLSSESSELTAEQLKEYLEHLRPEDFGKFNL